MIKFNSNGTIELFGDIVPVSIAIGLIRCKTAGPENITFYIDGMTEHYTIKYDQFIDEAGNPFANQGAVIQYVQENFLDASDGGGGVTMEQVTAITDHKADLDGNGKVPLTQINDALLGNVTFKGLYNGTIITSGVDAGMTGQPLPAAATGNKGWYFIAAADFTNGGNDYKTGDWIISTGTEWRKVDNTDAVATVNGRTGNVVVVIGDLALAQNQFLVGDGTGKGSARGVLPSDMGMNSALTGSSRVPVRAAGSDSWQNAGYPISAANLANSLPFRGGTGSIKAGVASAADECLVLSQFSPTVNDGLTASETSTSLNAAYAGAIVGFQVMSIANATAYRKVNATQWQKTAITIV